VGWRERRYERLRGKQSPQINRHRRGTAAVVTAGAKRVCSVCAQPRSEVLPVAPSRKASATVRTKWDVLGASLFVAKGLLRAERPPAPRVKIDGTPFATQLKMKRAGPSRRSGL
jgi:hypothetical protein